MNKLYTVIGYVDADGGCYPFAQEVKAEDPKGAWVAAVKAEKRAIRRAGGEVYSEQGVPMRAAEMDNASPILTLRGWGLGA